MRNNINRRGALKRVTLATGGVILTPTILSVLQSCQNAVEMLDWQPVFLNETQARTTMALADLILPKTDTPGATEAGVHIFIDSFANHCLNEEGQSELVSGLDGFNNDASDQYQKNFSELSVEDQSSLVGSTIENQDSEKSEFFLMFKRLTLTGFFNSQKGAEEALVYLDIPGEYLGCIPLEDQQRSWAI